MARNATAKGEEQEKQHMAVVVNVPMARNATAKGEGNVAL
jgi:hypothetical protein